MEVFAVKFLFSGMQIKTKKKTNKKKDVDRFKVVFSYQFDGDK
jgi:di/tripeptidase